MIWLDILLTTVAVVIGVCLTIGIIDRQYKIDQKRAIKIADDLAYATAKHFLKKHECQVRLEKWIKVAKRFNAPIKVQFD